MDRVQGTRVLWVEGGLIEEIGQRKKQCRKKLLELNLAAQEADIVVTEQ